jgi:SAM-dependent methyltransferase
MVARSRPSEKFGTDSRGRGTARSLGSVKAYYERRAPEYDEWYRGAGRFAERDRPGWEQEIDALTDALAALPPARTLDVACGTGFLTRHLPGEVVGLDQSETMLEEARRQASNASFVQGDALSLPFEDGAFERVFTAHFYGHLEDAERARFLTEARRLAPELVVVDSALREDVEAEERQERVLNDGSRWAVYKRYFEPDALADELGGSETVFAGRWFVAVRS